jgi:probable phosphoglycerate mutase
LTTPLTPRRSTTRQDVEDELDSLFRLEDEVAGEVLLVRHAQPANVAAPDAEAGLVPDPMLSCEGLHQAERLAVRLCSLWIDAVYTAPERRCFQTAKVVADVLQRPLSVIDGLADIAFDPGEARGDVASYSARFSREPRWESLPGFEPGKAFRRRAVSEIDGIVATHPARRCVVITHAGILNAYLSMLLCIPRDLFFAADHASITTVRYRGDMYALRGLNDTSHLALPDSAQGVLPAFTPRSLPLTNR